VARREDMEAGACRGQEYTTTTRGDMEQEWKTHVGR
jgi:hypothetical protein